MWTRGLAITFLGVVRAQLAEDLASAATCLDDASGNFLAAGMDCVAGLAAVGGNCDFNLAPFGPQAPLYVAAGTHVRDICPQTCGDCGAATVPVAVDDPADDPAGLLFGALGMDCAAALASIRESDVGGDACTFSLRGWLHQDLTMADLCAISCGSGSAAVTTGPPASSGPVWYDSIDGEEVAAFAAGCFWSIELSFSCVSPPDPALPGLSCPLVHTSFLRPSPPAQPCPI